MTNEKQFVSDRLTKEAKTAFIADEYTLNPETGKIRAYKDHYLLQPIELNVQLKMLKPKIAV